MFNTMFFLNAVLFGIGLAMDAFSVSLANGLHEPGMSKSRMGVIAGVFAGFQAVMPLIGWVCIHTIAEIFTSFEKIIPWIALILLLYIGGKMLWEGIRSKPDCQCAAVDCKGLILQGIATSIDALSVGFAIAEYSLAAAAVEALIIGIVTFVISIAGLLLGRIFGIKLSNKACILGGLILIGIGIEIFVKGVIL